MKDDFVYTSLSLSLYIYMYVYINCSMLGAVRQRERLRQRRDTVLLRGGRQGPAGAKCV